MGFWVSTPNIQRLIAKLDWKFSDSEIGKIRSKPKRMARFNPANNRNLRKIARLMRIWPGASANNTPALKWYGFLAWLHTKQNAATGHVVADDLRSAIFDGLMDAPNCLSISFVAIQGMDIRLTTSKIYPTAGQPSYILVVVLQTIDAGGVTQSDPGPNDGSDSQDDPGEDLPGVGFAKQKYKKVNKTRKPYTAKKAKKSKKAKKTKK
jgi:hypothetical protein